jgi:hypothetical protein
VTPIVVGREAAHTPSRFNVLSSIPLATISGGAHWKHADSPGTMNWMCPETAFSETPLSIQDMLNSRQAYKKESGKEEEEEEERRRRRRRKKKKKEEEEKETTM